MGLIYQPLSTVLNFGGADGSTTFINTGNSGAVLSTTGFGTPNITTANSKFGGSSGNFNSGAIRIGQSITTSQDFTLEAWCYLPADRTSIRPIFGNVVSSANVLMVNGNFISSQISGGFQNGSTQVPRDQWFHAAVSRKSDTVYLFLNGVIEPSTTTTTSATNEILIGGAGSSWGYFQGLIDDVRITLGRCIYDASFTPPTSEIGILDPINFETMLLDDRAIISDPLGAKARPKVLMSNTLLLQDGPISTLEYGFAPSEKAKLYNARTQTNASSFTPDRFQDQRGYGRISGTVKESALPANIPRQVRVFLYRNPDNRLERVVWSDAAGNYLFDGINLEYKYMVVAVDPTGNYRAVIADNIVPDAIPYPPNSAAA